MSAGPLVMSRQSIGEASRVLAASSIEPKQFDYFRDSFGVDTTISVDERVVRDAKSAESDRAVLREVALALASQLAMSCHRETSVVQDVVCQAEADRPLTFKCQQGLVVPLPAPDKCDLRGSRPGSDPMPLS